MEDNFQINLSDFSMGPDELEWLLKEWQKDPKPKTINEIARMYLTHIIEKKTGFLPYDRRNKYKKGNTITIIVKPYGKTLARVNEFVEYIGKDEDGFPFGEVELTLLDQTANLTGGQERDFICNYEGEKYAGEIISFEIIKEKDESEVIPKILKAISGDTLFVAFREHWLPKQLLITDIKDRLTQVEEIIARAKCLLSTREILAQLLSDDNKDNWNSCLEFSLNYFLNQDKKFTLIPDSVTKWDLHKPSVSHEKIQSKVTIKEDWVAKGIIILPKRLSEYMKGTNGVVHINYDQVDELLPYNHNERLIKGLDRFYSTKAVAEFDEVLLRLEILEPTTQLFIASTWRKSLNELLRMEPRDLDWEHSSLRDCIIVILAKFKTPAHYREIYSEIAHHKSVSISGIEATLSHYSPSVFTHVGWGKWQLADGEKTPEIKNTVNERPPIILPEPPDEEIWKVVQLIEEKDYVYKLLEKIKRPLSFNDICEKLSDLLKVNANKLKITGFLKADDKRLRRLDNGEWTLEEWSKQTPTPNVNENADISEVIPDNTTQTGASRYFLVILLILFLLITITGVILFWLSI